MAKRPPLTQEQVGAFRRERRRGKLAGFARSALQKHEGGRGTFIQRSRGISPEEKAIFHQVSGAGKSRIRRRFLELSDSDVDAILQSVDRHIEEALKRSA